MASAPLSLEERNIVLSRFLRKYLQRGFTIVTRTPTTAELYKPARFPAWLFPEKTIFVDIEETGSIYVRKT